MIDPRARYLIELYDHDPNDDYNETAKGRWSEELAARFIGKTSGLTFVEAAAAILALFREGWDSNTIYWARDDPHYWEDLLSECQRLSGHEPAGHETPAMADHAGDQ